MQSRFPGPVFPSIYDATLTQVMGGTLVKVCAWYDN